MARKKTAPAAAAGGEQSEATAAAVAALKAEGDKAFGAKAYSKALDVYGKAVKLVSGKPAERALFHSNRAACLMMLKKHKEAVKECSAALDAQPGYTKALARRARAYEQQDRYKEALADISLVNKGEAATNDTRAQESRLKALMSGKGKAVSTPARANPSNRNTMYFTAKATLDGETRVLQFAASATFAHLKEIIRVKFSNVDLEHFNVKYVDSAGDVVTIAGRDDIQVALNDLIQSASRGLGSHGPKLSPNMLPSLRLEITKTSAADEVPVPPQEAADIARLKAQMEAYQKAAAAVQEKARAEKQQAQQQQEQQVVELDEWLVDFAHLFREMMGFDPDRHIDLHNEGWEKCTAALDEAVKSEKAMPLFEAAAERFKEVTATGLYNWGNVHMCIARKLCDEAIGKQLPAKDVASAAEEHFKQAEKRYQEALDYKKDFFDATLGKGQLAFERAKIAAGFLIGQPKPEGEASKAATEKQQALVAEALKNLKAGDVRASSKHFNNAHSLFKQALGDIPEEAEKRLADQRAKEGGGDDMTLAGQVLVMWGNVLYEQSQMLSAVGDKNWKNVLEDAVSKFKEAGCKAEDIRNAVSNHTMKDDLDLDSYGPPPKEPEEEKTEEPAKEVKGLPSLGKQPAKK